MSTWTKSAVYARYVEAFETALALPGVGPSMRVTPRVEILRERGDGNPMEEGRYLDGEVTTVKDGQLVVHERVEPFSKGKGFESFRGRARPSSPKGWDRPPAPSAAAIDRMQDVIVWTTRYLAPTDPIAAKVLHAFVRRDVMRKRLPACLRALGLDVSRRSAFRIKDRALGIVVAGLMRDRVACLRQAG